MMPNSTVARYAFSCPHRTFSEPPFPSQRVAYVYRAKREIQGSMIRVIWGYVCRCLRYAGCLPHSISTRSMSSRVTRPHGNSGVVKSKFSSNLPPRAFGASVRIVRVTRFP
ncbi:hypothetical protein JVT61DRAFT_12262 [Boletus reticuloceps]|uniref:Uncharacterized protein n=1 Tax=Boletus reticuloceps TaxID=495285 RepID=A0A8I2YE16_9AGAM|nr:hypothetical protein JVT61DRAFT_12262 [Boletus reticuloceps]